ncbi:aldehyde dehydrogenase [Blyttiomyces helicus]|uniref:Aldehyde dehydrogenase n=1 Tax=Blyttiomyces helicus TaxID=388810 RepID=A0A4P9W4Z7_9FUNG|nr:aldehyde dehydrogenase [Blyttiomyces helicus]|eukprot:RKO87449.1 aldehyde dehydrogenase [Blyttiomyces helicus]
MAVTYSVPTGLFIDGQFIPGVAGKTFATVNPVTGETITQVHEALKEDVDIAVNAAKKALKVWTAMLPAQRGALLLRLADLIEANADELAAIESLDNGKPFLVARALDVAVTAGTMRYYGGWADKIHGKVIDYSPALHSFTRHESLGVVGQIIPWNFPLLMLSWKLGPALACGNTVVLKTSEKTPLSALRLCELINEAGFPPGVVNVISGFGPTAGDAIARHMDIRKVAFTGSSAVGRLILKAAADSNLKKVTLELGGKSANIVCDDADLDQAVEAASTGIFFNQGQVCCAGSRVFVQDGIYDAFVEKFKAKSASLKVGDPTHPETSVGPVVDKLQFDRVLSYINKGKSEGAKCLSGGAQVGSKGYFIQPTLFIDVSDSMTIAQEEIFGPVACVIRFKTIDEVIERANANPYGLAAGVHTTNIKTAVKLSNALHAGTVWVNCYNILVPSIPFGGFKESGIGRELGKYALKEYTGT